MTRAEIIEELRRSAREDADPYADCEYDAWRAAERWRGLSDVSETEEDERAFFLLVACALEDEC